MKLKPLACAVLLALAVAIPAASAGGAPGADAARAGWVLRFHAPTHHPRAGRAWRITVSAHTRGGKALKAVLHYEVFLHGVRVAKRQHHVFRGTFHQTFRWPKAAIGLPLVFRPVVKTRLGTKHVDYAVKVRR